MIPATHVEPKSDETKGDALCTRARILAATRLLYANKGSRGTTTREVADRAEVNEATVFRHFGTKQQLLAAMLDHFNSDSSLAETFNGLRRYSTVDEQLNALGRSAVEALRRKQDLMRIAMGEEMANPESTTCVWRIPTEVRLRVSSFFGEKVAAGELRGDPDLLGRTFMSLFFSYVMAGTLWAELGETPQEQIVASMVDIFLNGARAV